jgi:predicted Fe-S protein YdhL (DUF1289 family)
MPRRHICHDSRHCVDAGSRLQQLDSHVSYTGNMDDATTQRLLARERRRAERQRLLASGPPSPCVSVCQMDPMTGYCVGCLRTIDGIRDWIITPPDERQKILDQLPGRKERSGL